MKKLGGLIVISALLAAGVAVPAKAEVRSGSGDSTTEAGACGAAKADVRRAARALNEEITGFSQCSCSFRRGQYVDGYVCYVDAYTRDKRD